MLSRGIRPNGLKRRWERTVNEIRALVSNGNFNDSHGEEPHKGARPEPQCADLENNSGRTSVYQARPCLSVPRLSTSATQANIVHHLHSSHLVGLLNSKQQSNTLLEQISTCMAHHRGATTSACPKSPLISARSNNKPDHATFLTQHHPSTSTPSLDHNRPSHEP